MLIAVIGDFAEWPPLVLDCLKVNLANFSPVEKDES